MYIPRLSIFVLLKKSQKTKETLFSLCVVRDKFESVFDYIYLDTYLINCLVKPHNFQTVQLLWDFVSKIY